MVTRKIETAISQDNLNSQIIAFLYAMGFAHDDEEIVDIELGKKPDTGPIPLKYTIKKRQEVELLEING